jgi:hypothetical protein
MASCIRTSRNKVQKEANFHTLLKPLLCSYYYISVFLIRIIWFVDCIFKTRQNNLCVLVFLFPDIMNGEEISQIVKLVTIVGSWESGKLTTFT